MDPIPTESNSAPCAADQHRLLLSGLDSLFVGYYLDPVGSKLDFDDLTYQQALRQEDRALAYEPIRLGSREFLLRPHGGHPYKFVIYDEDFEIRFTERMQPNFYVRFLSKGLWLKGVGQLENDLKDFFGSLRLNPLREEGVSRADWAFDYHLTNPDFKIEHFVSKAKKDNVWRSDGEVETLTFGKGDTVVRVYDKVVEIEQQSDKSWFHQLWDRKTEVWRIEVQARRERLKVGGIDTLRDLHDLSADLLREVLRGHTTLRAPSGDSNRSRWPLAPLWQNLLGVIDQLPQTGLVAAYDPATELDYRIAKHTQAVYGNLKHLAALHGIKTRKGAQITLEDLLAALPGYAGPYHSPDEWTQEVARKIKAVEAGK